MSQRLRRTPASFVLCALIAAVPLTGGCGDDGNTTATDTARGDTSAGDTAATDTAADTVDQSPIELLGHWATNFGEEFHITPQRWGPSTLVRYDNATNEAVLQAPAWDPYSPNAFSKLVWTEPDADGGFHLCFVAFGHATADDASGAAAVFDASDPDSGGCGESGFAWTRVFAAVEVSGDWATNFGYDERISSHTWGGFSTVALYSNDDNWAITQNMDDAAFDPGKFNLLFWTEPADGAFHFCTAGFGYDTLEEALDADPEHDSATPDVSGCGDLSFSWTRATGPSIELIGSWVDDDNTSTTIGSFAWADGNVTAYDNDANDAVVSFDGGFSHFSWLDPTGATAWFCETVRGAATAEAARGGATPDPSNPAQGGCGDGPWTSLSAQ